MQFDTPTSTVLYTIEEAIKAYRKFCQKSIDQNLPGATMDQMLLMVILDRNPMLNQKEIANLVFKDYASVTRMIELLVQKKFITRRIHPDDRRRFQLTITKEGKQVLKKLQPSIEHSRQTALQDVSDKEMKQLYKTLKKIISNCQTK